MTDSRPAGGRLVHILTSGMGYQNARGFLFPIVHNRRRLRAAGVRYRLFRAVADGLDDCDALLLDSKALDRAWDADPAGLLAKLDGWRRRCPVAYFDLTDSASWLRPEVLGHVTLYYKNQLLRDRALLQQPLYGYRLYTDHYHRHDGVDDAVPAWSTPLAPAEADRLRIAWNAGLANYAIYGPRLSVVYQHLPLPGLLFYPRRFHPPDAPRPVGLSCRMNVSYGRQTIAHQRQRARARLAGYARTDRLSKWGYFRELRDSRLVASPFGWGEINQKDFECFLSGAAVLKPDLSHLETWPDWFVPGETYVPHRWDMDDLLPQVERYLEDDARRLAIARAAQQRYRWHIATPQGHAAFTERFCAVLAELQAVWQADRS